jgi:hypothetical protein
VLMSTGTHLKRPRQPVVHFGDCERMFDGS